MTVAEPREGRVPSDFTFHDSEDAEMAQEQVDAGIAPTVAGEAPAKEDVGFLRSSRSAHPGESALELKGLL